MLSEAVTHLPAVPLRPFVTRCLGYRYEGFEPGIHLGMPGRTLTVIISFDAPLTLAMGGPATDATDHVLMVSGLHDRAVEIRHDGSQHGVQLDLTPAGARAFFEVAPGALAGSAVDVADLWTTSLAAELYERTASATSWTERFEALDDVLLQALVAHADRADRARPAATDAWQLIVESGGAIRVADLAAALGWSRRHLTAQFTAEYGLAPKTMAGVIRFERSVALLKRRDRPRLTDIAAACGYADQPHMSREWQRYAGTSPTAWLVDEQLPFVQDDDRRDSAA